jgi:hypothetical protein
MPASGGKHRRWPIETTPQIRQWLGSLTTRDRARMTAAIDQLQLDGPNLPSQRAKLIRSSRHPNMKELRSAGGHLRVLFAFDKRQRAILLVGGNKAGNWKGWYKQHVPLADAAYAQHQRSLGKEGSWRTAARTGGRSAQAGR